jgi:hypothetical protein
MSRRSDREGVWRSEINRRRNEACAKHKMNERGWVVPEEVWQGWTAWNTAVWYTRYRLALFKDASAYERSEYIRYVRLYLEESRLCRRPVLP